MSDIKSWSQTAASNNSASPNGFPELMPRSGVNDSAREVMASLKRFYDDPSWRDPFVGFTLSRTNGTTWVLTDDTKTNAEQYFALIDTTDKQLVKIEQGGNVWVGKVTSATYAATATTVVIAWIDHVSQDTTGPTTASSATFELYHSASGNIVFRDTGSSSGQVPTIDDLDAHVLTAEGSLDVGFLGGHTREEIELHSARGRLNINGSCEIWQRGTSFTSSTALTNDDGNVTADGYTIISDGNNRVNVSRDTDAPVGFINSIKLAGVSSQTYGLINMVELSDCADAADTSSTLRVSGSFYAKFDGAATGIDTLRVYLLKFNSSTPGDPVSAWGGAGFNFSPSGNWTIASSTTVTLTSAWQRFTPFENINVSGATGGIAIAFHTDEGALVGGEAFFVTGVQINIGENNLPFVRESMARELIRCQRYCVSTMENGKIGDANGTDEAIAAFTTSGGNCYANWDFPVEMYKVPTVDWFNPRTSTANPWDDGSNARAVASQSASAKRAWVTCTTGSNNTLHHIAGYAHANIWGNS